MCNRCLRVRDGGQPFNAAETSGVVLKITPLVCYSKFSKRLHQTYLEMALFLCAFYAGQRQVTDVGLALTRLNLTSRIISS